jgi:hypothetical protein
MEVIGFEGSYPFESGFMWGRPFIKLKNCVINSFTGRKSFNDQDLENYLSRFPENIKLENEDFDKPMILLVKKSSAIYKLIVGQIPEKVQNGGFLDYLFMFFTDPHKFYSFSRLFTNFISTELIANVHNLNEASLSILDDALLLHDNPKLMALKVYLSSIDTKPIHARKAYRNLNSADFSIFIDTLNSLEAL